MVVLCGNCEEREAIEICEQCEGEDSLFCQQCWSIHVQVKAFRKHTSHSATSIDNHSNSSNHLNLQKLKLEKGKTKRPEKVSQDKPTKHALDAAAPDLKLKKGYAEGVKEAFLNFSNNRPNYDEDFKAMFSIPENEHSTTDDVDITQAEQHSEPTTFLEYCDNLIEACNNISETGEMDTNTMVYGFIAALLVHIVTKVIFGTSQCLNNNFLNSFYK